MITCSTEVQNVLLPINRIMDNVATFGEYDAALLAKNNKVLFSIYYHLRFGKAPRSRASGQPVSSKQ